MLQYSSRRITSRSGATDRVHPQRNYFHGSRCVKGANFNGDIVTISGIMGLSGMDLHYPVFDCLIMLFICRGCQLFITSDIYL